jgi:hypothetical protein
MAMNRYVLSRDGTHQMGWQAAGAGIYNERQSQRFLYSHD